MFEFELPTGTGLLAKSRRRSALLWVLIALAVSPVIALALALMLPRVNKARRAA